MHWPHMHACRPCGYHSHSMAQLACQYACLHASSPQCHLAVKHLCKIAVTAADARAGGRQTAAPGHGLGCQRTAVGFVKTILPPGREEWWAASHTWTSSWKPDTPLLHRQELESAYEMVGAAPCYQQGQCQGASKKTLPACRLAGCVRPCRSLTGRLVWSRTVPWRCIPTWHAQQASGSGLSSSMVATKSARFGQTLDDRTMQSCC